MIRIVREFGVLGCCEVIGALIVAIGCLGELWIILNKLTKHVEPLAKNSGLFWRLLARIDSVFRPIVLRLKIKGRKLPEVKEQLLERMFVTLVALGVGMEFICLFFSLHEVADLNERAGQARKFAAVAYDRASSNELQVAQITQTNLVLRTKLAQLALKLQPRIIMPEQVTNFIFLTERITKIPIKICAGPDSQISYAGQLRNMFTLAGFGTDKSVNSSAGITYDFNVRVVRPPGQAYEWPYILTVAYGTNPMSKTVAQRVLFEKANGFLRPVTGNTNDQNEILADLQSVFGQIDIPFARMENDYWVKPGEVAILVPPKND